MISSNRKVVPLLKCLEVVFAKVWRKKTPADRLMHAGLQTSLGILEPAHLYLGIYDLQLTQVSTDSGTIAAMQVVWMDTWAPGFIPMCLKPLDTSFF